MYLIYQFLCFQDQLIVSYLVSTGNQPIIKKSNYSTNQGAHSKKQNLPFSKHDKIGFEHLRSQCLKKPLPNISLCKHLNKFIYYPTHQLHKYCLQVLTHECHVYMLQCPFILIWSLGERNASDQKWPIYESIR